MKRGIGITPQLALAAAFAVGLGACGDTSGLGVYDGGVRFVITADAALAPADGLAPTASLDGAEEHDGRLGFFESANVTFTSILARDLDGVLVDVAMELPVTVDVVTMEEGRQIVLPDGELPPATYDQLVVVMSTVQGVTYDGTTITIEPPGGGWTAIVPVCPFDVEDGATTVVGLSFNVRHAFSWRDGRYFFRPAFHCDAAEDTTEDPS